MHGYTSKILNIDLTDGTVENQGFDPDIASRFIGGAGIGTDILFREVPPDTDALSKDNVVILAVGPLTGTEAPCNGRIELTMKSPLTGVIASCNTGGYFGPLLKWAGYDAVVLRGASKHPVYIWIDDGTVEIRRADHLWGRDTWETTDILRKELGETRQNEISVMAIGPAGENLVRFACLINEYYHAAGRCGPGAVFGSKNIKAIAVRGTKKVPIARPAEFKEATRETVERLKKCMPQTMESYHRHGVLAIPSEWQRKGCLAGKNSQVGVLPGWAENVGFEVSTKYLTKNVGSCYRCPVRCFTMVEVDEGKYAGLKISTGVMNHPIAQFGARLAAPSLPFIWKCKEECHKLGLDLGSTAGTIAFAMELYQRGIIDESKAGARLEWGNEDAALETMHNIARRRGFGDILADGSRMAAARIGADSARYALTIKGLEIIGSDPRVGNKLWNAGCLDNPRGGDAIRNTHTLVLRPPEPHELAELGLTADEYVKVFVDYLDMSDEVKKEVFGVPPRLEEAGFGRRAAVLSKWYGDLCSALNTLILCMLPSLILNGFGPTTCARMLSACTGETVTGEDLMRTGERIYNLQRMYSVRCGLDRKDDDFPARFYDEGIQGGPRAGARLSRAETSGYLDEYYRLRGWDAAGIPTPAKLDELGIGYAAVTKT